jgi:hypothetical protein
MQPAAAAEIKEVVPNEGNQSSRINLKERMSLKR